MIDLTQAVDASARRVLGERYETFDKVALSNLKQELLNVIVPAYAAIQEALRTEVSVIVTSAYNAGLEGFGLYEEFRAVARDAEIQKALDALEIG